MAAAPMGKARLARLLKQLEAHALGERQLSATQIRAIELLIRKDGSAGASSKEGENRAVIFHIRREITCRRCRELQDEASGE